MIQQTMGIKKGAHFSMMPAIVQPKLFLNTSVTSPHMSTSVSALVPSLASPHARIRQP